MLSPDFLGGLRGPDGLPDWLRSTGCALLYWLVFLLALEPGNVLHARSMGHVLDFDDEALRIGCAALLGCSTAPLILALSRRFPISGTRGWRSIAIHAAGAATLSFVLIVISCVLAAWVLMGEIVPSVAEVRSELAGNWLLLTFALCAFAAISQAMNLFPRRSSQADPRCRQDNCRQDTGTSGLPRPRQHRVDRKPGKLSGAARRRPVSPHSRDVAEFRQPARSRPVHPRPQARDRGHRSDTRNPATRERRLDIDIAGRPHDSRQSQLS